MGNGAGPLDKVDGSEAGPHDILKSSFTSLYHKVDGSEAAPHDKVDVGSTSGSYNKDVDGSEVGPQDKVDGSETAPHDKVNVGSTATLLWKRKAVSSECITYQEKRKTVPLQLVPTHEILRDVGSRAGDFPPLQLGFSHVQPYNVLREQDILHVKPVASVEPRTTPGEQHTKAVNNQCVQDPFEPANVGSEAGPHNEVDGSEIAPHYKVDVGSTAELLQFTPCRRKSKRKTVPLELVPTHEILRDVGSKAEFSHVQPHNMLREQGILQVKPIASIELRTSPREQHRKAVNNQCMQDPLEYVNVVSEVRSHDMVDVGSRALMPQFTPYHPKRKTVSLEFVPTNNIIRDVGSAAGDFPALQLGFSHVEPQYYWRGQDILQEKPISSVEPERCFEEQQYSAICNDQYTPHHRKRKSVLLELVPAHDIIQEAGSTPGERHGQAVDGQCLQDPSHSTNVGGEARSQDKVDGSEAGPHGKVDGSEIGSRDTVNVGSTSGIIQFTPRCHRKRKTIPLELVPTHDIIQHVGSMAGDFYLVKGQH